MSYLNNIRVDHHQDDKQPPPSPAHPTKAINQEQPSTKPPTASSNFCYEIIDQILSFLPRSLVNSEFDPASDSNLMCAGVCMNWLTVARRSAKWFVELRNEEEARRFLAAMESNEAFVKVNPKWPSMNASRSLRIGKVNSLFWFSNSFFR
jgi:hypothetical protein